MLTSVNMSPRCSNESENHGKSYTSKCSKNALIKGPWTLALCLTPAVSMTNGNFLQTCLTSNIWPNSAPLQDTIEASKSELP